MTCQPLDGMELCQSAKGEHAFHYIITAGQGRVPAIWKTTSESVDTVENAGLTLVEPVDNFAWAVVRPQAACYHRRHPQDRCASPCGLDICHSAPNTCRSSPQEAWTGACAPLAVVEQSSNRSDRVALSTEQSCEVRGFHSPLESPRSKRRLGAALLRLKVPARKAAFPRCGNLCGQKRKGHVGPVNGSVLARKSAGR
jgi:hypothetical protein